MTLDLKIGDPWPFLSARGLVTTPCDPVWHALIVPTQQEARAKKLLENAGVHVTYPTQTKGRVVNGKLYETERPMISRIIYAKFSYTPQWHIMRERRVIQGVFARDNVPIVLSPDDVSRVMGLPTEAERIEAERIEAERPRAGEKAEIIDGPFKGFFVDVEKTASGRVWWTFMNLKGEVPQANVRRVAG